MSFCVKCGAELINGVCPNCKEEPKHTPIRSESDEYKKFYVDPNEKFVCSIGNDNNKSFLSTGSKSKGFALVSDKRVYFNGTASELSGKRKNRKIRISRTVDLKDVTGTDTQFGNEPVQLVVGIVFAVLTLVFTIITIIISSSAKNSTAAIPMIIFLIIPLLLISLIFIIRYFKGRISILTISYAGGCIEFNVKGHSAGECDEFQKKLRQAKDRVAAEAESAIINAMREAIAGAAPQRAQSQPVQEPQAAAVSSADELEKYAQLYKDGKLSEEEFKETTSRLLSK